MKKHTHIAPKLKKIEHKPSIRLILFIAAILASVIVLHSLHLGHEHTTVATIGLGAVINRGIEVLTDVVCDRLFPEMF